MDYRDYPSTGYERKELSTVLYSNASGQQETNQIHNRHELTSDSHSKIKFNNTTATKLNAKQQQTITMDYGELNDNRKKFERKTTRNVGIDGTKQQLELLITSKNKHPLLGLDWMRNLGVTLESEKIITNINHMNNPENTIERNITTLKRKFTELFTENQSVKSVEVDIQLKEEAKLIQQKVDRYQLICNPLSKKESKNRKKTRAYRKSKKH